MDATYDPSGVFGDLIAAKQQRDGALIEQACEQALQGGQYGVLAMHFDDTTLVAAPHPSVPYGEIFHAPSSAASPEARFRAFTRWSVNS